MFKRKYKTRFARVLELPDNTVDFGCQPVDIVAESGVDRLVRPPFVVSGSGVWIRLAFPETVVISGYLLHSYWRQITEKIESITPC